MVSSRLSRDDDFTQRSPRVVTARRLLRRRHRDEAGLFLAEGPQAVREALLSVAVTEIFGTAESYRRHGDLVELAHSAAVSLWPITEAGLGSLTETVTPQGVVAVCRQSHYNDVSELPLGSRRLVVVLAGVADPGNAGTVLRTADAAGASAVIFTGGSVDPYNGKCVRASAGSLFHLDLVRGESAHRCVEALAQAGMTVLAADAHGSGDLMEFADAGGLSGRTAWVFGSEAHGLAPDLAELAAARVRVPIYGQAESLNLAAAAAVCLYASARAHRHPGASE